MIRPNWLVFSLAALVGASGALARQDQRKPKNPKQDVEAIGARDVGKGVNFYSIEQEIALGGQLAREVERTAKILDDPVVSEYVNRLGQNLVRNSDAKLPFTIKVIDSDEVNAFALPGGFFFVNSGLIGLAQSDAELAGVMAHEIAHVTARHGTRQASRAQIASLASIPLIFLGGGIGYAVNQAANFGVPLTFLKFSRGFESEADLLGVQYLYEAGYDPAAMVSFFERLEAREKKKPGALAKAFRSHPATGDRVKKVQTSINELLPARKEYAVASSEFADMKTRLDRLYAGRPKENADPGRPTLRRRPSGGTIPAEAPERPGEEKDGERPTLKRRNLGSATE